MVRVVLLMKPFKNGSNVSKIRGITYPYQKRYLIINKKVNTSVRNNYRAVKFVEASGTRNSRIRSPSQEHSPNNGELLNIYLLAKTCTELIFWSTNGISVYITGIDINTNWQVKTLEWGRWWSHVIMFFGTLLFPTNRESYTARYCVRDKYCCSVYILERFESYWLKDSFSINNGWALLIHATNCQQGFRYIFRFSFPISPQ